MEPTYFLYCHFKALPIIKNKLSFQFGVFSNNPLKGDLWKIMIVDHASVLQDSKNWFFVNFSVLCWQRLKLLHHCVHCTSHRVYTNFFPKVWWCYPVPVLHVNMARGVATRGATQNAYVLWKMNARLRRDPYVAVMDRTILTRACWRPELVWWEKML